MLNTIAGVAAALVLAAKQETAYLNINEKAYLVQETGIVSIIKDEEDIFFGLAAKDNGVTAIYVSDNCWMRSKVKVVSTEDNYDWEFKLTGGTATVD